MYLSPPLSIFDHPLTAFVVNHHALLLPPRHIGFKGFIIQEMLFQLVALHADEPFVRDVAFQAAGF